MWVSEPGWQPATSFPEPLVPPGVEPDVAPMVQVCVNQSWVPYIIGALSQLVQPVIWDVPDAATLESTIGSATDLMALFANAGDCVSIVLGYSCTNGLQISYDGGVTYEDVPGWLANFCTCVTACIVPPTPPNPNNDVTQQHACNIAGYIATDIIQTACTQVIAFAQQQQQQVNFVNKVMGALSFAFPIAALGTAALSAFFSDYLSGVVANYTAASTDVTLWSSVTCAIYAAIQNDGMITAANLPTVISNVCGITYAHADVLASICGFITNVGLGNLQAMQNVGAVAVVDCSACATPWCWYMDMRNGPNGWTAESGAGAWLSSGLFGAGWYQQVASATRISLRLHLVIPNNAVVDSVDIWLVDPNDTAGCSGCDRHIYLENTSNVIVSTTELPDGPYASVTKIATGLSVAASAHEVIIYFDSFRGAQPSGMIQQVTVHGLGVNPFGPDNCAGH